MEFRYRAREGPSSFNPYFSSMQSFRGDMFGGEFRRPEPLRGPPMMMAREALRREMEKERIREEIFTREIMRRRELEEEVRRELAFAREIVLRRQADRFSLAPSSARLPMRSPQLLELRIGERVAPLSTRDILEDVLAGNESTRRISEVKEEGNAVVETCLVENFGGPADDDGKGGLRREMAKERIREEIFTREIMRRRKLEEEARRELAFKREIALRRRANRFSLAPSSAGSPMRSPQLLELGV